MSISPFVTMQVLAAEYLDDETVRPLQELEEAGLELGDFRAAQRDLISLGPTTVDLAYEFTNAAAILIVADAPFSLRLAAGERQLTNVRAFIVWGDDEKEGVHSGSVLLTGNTVNTAKLRIWAIESTDATPSVPDSPIGIVSLYRPSEPTTLYVNPAGDDNYDGLTIDTPFATPERAIEEVARSSLSKEHVTIYTSAGTYTLEDAAALGSVWGGIAQVGTRSKARFSGHATGDAGDSDFAVSASYEVVSNAGSSEAAGWVLQLQLVGGGAPGLVADALVGEWVETTAGPGIVLTNTTDTITVLPQYVTSYPSPPAAASQVDVVDPLVTFNIPNDGDLLLANLCMQYIDMYAAGANGNGRVVCDGTVRFARSRLIAGGLELLRGRTVADFSILRGVGDSDTTTYRSGLVRVAPSAHMRWGQGGLICPTDATAKSGNSYVRVEGRVELLAPMALRGMGTRNLLVDGGRIDGNDEATLTPALRFYDCAGPVKVTNGGHIDAQLWGADGITGDKAVAASRNSYVRAQTGSTLTCTANSLFEVTANADDGTPQIGETPQTGGDGTTVFTQGDVLSSSSPSGEVIVAKNGGDYATITAALAAATAGQTVKVYPGTYTERLDFATIGVAAGVRLTGSGNAQAIIIEPPDDTGPTVSLVGGTWTLRELTVKAPASHQAVVVTPGGADLVVLFTLVAIGDATSTAENLIDISGSGTVLLQEVFHNGGVTAKSFVYAGGTATILLDGVIGNAGTVEDLFHLNGATVIGENLRATPSLYSGTSGLRLTSGDMQLADINLGAGVFTNGVRVDADGVTCHVHGGFINSTTYDFLADAGLVGTSTVIRLDVVIDFDKKSWPAGYRDTADLILDYGIETGWANYQDGTHTVGSPQALLAGTRAQWTNDAATALEDYRPGKSALWSGDLIVPTQVGQAFELRIDFTIHPGAVNGLLTVDLDIGSDPFGIDSNIIVERTQSLAKGAVAQKVSMAFPIFCLATFLANGGAIGITCDKAANVYDKSITIVRLH